MNGEFILGQVAGHKLEIAVRRNGGTLEDIDYLSTGNNFRAVTLLRTGQAKLVEVSNSKSEGVVIPTVSTPLEWSVDCEGNIHFVLISNGFTGEKWEQHFEHRGFWITDDARQVLRRASEAATNGVLYHIVVRPRRKINNSDNITKKIRVAANEKGWVRPHWEVACLIRDKFTDRQLEQMGLYYILTMHKPIKDSGGDPLLLVVACDHGHLLGTYSGKPNVRWGRNGGFAFVVSQASSQH